MPRPALLSRLAGVLTFAGALIACSGPSKSQAMEQIQAGVKEEGNCTLPLEMLTLWKVQHTTKAICVPKEGAEKAKTCVDALVAAGITKPMPAAYMVAWPDDVAAASLKDVPAYERRARNLVYSTCVEIGLLRDGRFECADAKADKILRIGVLDDKNADVRYARAITMHPTLAAIEAACGSVSRPPAEATVQFTKAEKAPWTLATKPPAE